jgi:transcription antitermination factor NusG
MADPATTGDLSVVTQLGEASLSQADSTLNQPFAECSWFAVQTKARHEKRIAAELTEEGIVAFLPLSKEVHQWSDRKRKVEVPLFSTYVFVRIGGDRNHRVTVLKTNGVFRFVGIRGAGVPIPKEQIETLQTIIREKVCFSPHPFLNVGRKVRIRGGSLDGICGILSAIYDNQSLIVSVDSIQRSLALQIDGYGIEPI